MQMTVSSKNTLLILPLNYILRFTLSNLICNYLRVFIEYLQEIGVVMASSSPEPSARPEGSSGNDVCGGESSETAGPAGSDQLSLYRLLKKAKKERVCTAKERISKMPPCAAGKRSSVYRGVTRHRWTGRYEAHLWDKSTWNQNQNKKGKQGAYDDEEAAARAYDLAALKYWGPGTLINFRVTDYTRDLEEMQNLSREDYLASLRRKSSGFTRGISKYRPPSCPRDSRFGHFREANDFRSKHHGDDVTAENEHLPGFCMDQKIDLSSYIKWWGPTTKVQALEEPKHGCSEDCSSNEVLELTVHPTQPYEMPRLGLSQKGGKNNQKVTPTSTPTIMSILSQSAAYKSLQEKASKNKEKVEDDENNSDNYGKTIEMLNDGSAGGRDSELGALFGGTGSSGGLAMINRNLNPLTPILSAPLMTNYNGGGIDALADPVLWSPLVASVFPSGSTSSHAAPEITKQESVSDYTFFQRSD
ncbi:unnamed protein product [Cuscuta epithymum]|uniref:AP2/ERF domain-containing protein n=1 Tax=Cuscuta epithymum TaxID=186058 RepID=A0AAV0FZY1_9ASTE|nr:unnamed protein product [Cuscuta epithymum]